jgi:hypothetical protein
MPERTQITRGSKLLQFAAARLVEKHGEHPRVDFVLAMRDCAERLSRRPLRPIWRELVAGAIALCIVAAICWTLWGFALPAVIWTFGIFAIVVLVRYTVAEWLL